MIKIIKKIVGALVTIVLVAWLVMFVMDFFSAKEGKRPMFCLDEVTVNYDGGVYNKCISFGYQYYEYVANSSEGESGYGFGPSFIKPDIERKIENAK